LYGKALSDIPPKPSEVTPEIIAEQEGWKLQEIEVGETIAKEAATTPAGRENPWGKYWDEYNALGDNWQAKYEYMMANPEFAAYYINKYGKDAWFLNYGKSRTSASYGAYRSYYGGYRGGGSSWEYPKNLDRGTPQHYRNMRAREFPYWLMPKREDMPRWTPPRSTRSWMEAGARLRPDKLSKWRSPI
jgi:hypothetical protein